MISAAGVLLGVGVVVWDLGRGDYYSAVEVAGSRCRNMRGAATHTSQDLPPSGLQMSTVYIMHFFLVLVDNLGSGDFIAG